MGWRKKILYNILLFLLISFLFLLGSFENLENLFIDLSYRWNAKEKDLEKSPVVLVAIDSPSLEEIGSWPWQRNIHARGLEKIFAAGAKVVGLDLLFLEKKEGDEILAEAMKLGPVFLPLALDISIIRRFYQETLYVRKSFEPIPALAHAAEGIGHVNFLADQDGIIRRFTSLEDFPSWCKILAEAYTHQPITIDNERTYINFIAPGNPFPTISYLDLLKGNYSPAFFQNRVVLIGSTDPTLGDQVMTPFSRHGFVPGVIINAHAVTTLIERNFITRLPPASILLIFVIITISSSISLSRMEYKRTIMLLILQIVAILILGQFLFNRGIILDRIPLLLGVVFPGAVHLYDIIALGEQKQREMKKLFQRYLPAHLAQEIAANPQKVNLKGERKKVAVLFIDLRNFSNWSKQRTPEEAVKLLNIFFQGVTEASMARGGTLDKFLGDGALIVFGAPIPVQYPCQECLKVLVSVHKKLQELDFPLAFGAGIEVGEVVAGHIGSEKRMEYTFIGPAVDLASHLESMAKPGQVLLGPEAIEELPDDLKKVRYGDYLILNIENLGGLDYE